MDRLIRFFSPDFNSPTITPSNFSPSVNYRAITRPPLSPEKMESLQAVEKIVNYSFANKSLLEEALTHTSCVDFPSYERLEFVGDSAIGLALTNYLYLTYPNAEPHELSQLRAANVSTEKFARVALKHGLYRFLRRNAPSLDEKVTKSCSVFFIWILTFVGTCSCLMSSSSFCTFGVVLIGYRVLRGGVQRRRFSLLWWISESSQSSRWPPRVCSRSRLHRCQLWSAKILGGLCLVSCLSFYHT